MEDDKDSLDIFDLDSPMDIHSKRTPSKFVPKLKGGKVKSESSKTIHESNESTSVSESAPDSMQEDDPVVREIDVFYTPIETDDSDAQLHIMQYPLRPRWNSYEHTGSFEEVKMKPDGSEAEIIWNVGVNMPHHDERKQILRSTKANPSAPCVVGTLLGNKLHLNPVHSVWQFRPSIEQHIYGSVAEQQKQQTSSEDHGMSSEPWVSLEYNPIGSTSSRKYLKMMTNPRDQDIGTSITPLECMESLCPQTPPKEVSIISFMVSFPLEERIREWFCKQSQVNRFNALKHFDTSKSEDDLLKILERHAYLVQGLWVAKSSLICEGHEAQLRDYIIFLFSNNPVLKKTTLTELRAKSDILKRLLEPLAYERPSLDDWKFREERDDSFIKGHKRIADEHKLAWSDRGKQLQEYLSSSGKTVASVRKDFPNSSLAQRNSSAQEGKSASRKGPDQSMSNEQKESIKSALKQVFHDQKPRSMNTIIQELRDLTIAKSSRLKVNTLASAVAIAVVGSRPSPDFLSALNEVTIEVHKIYFLRNVDEKLDPVRYVFLGVFARKEPGAKLTKEEMIEACKVLKRDIPDSEYRMVVKELCNYKKGICRLKDPDNKD